MRILLAAIVLLGFSIPSFAEEPRSFDASALPHTQEGLAALDSKQLRIVRRTTSQCNATEPMFAGTAVAQRPCIISGVDHAIESTGDPALQAYHAALPFNARYDRYRSPHYCQQIVDRYGH